MFLDVGKEGEELWKEGEEGGLPHHSKALVVVLGAADTALPEPLRERLELLELERLATDEIGDGSYLQQIQCQMSKCQDGGVKIMRVMRANNSGNEFLKNFGTSFK